MNKAGKKSKSKPKRKKIFTKKNFIETEAEEINTDINNNNNNEKDSNLFSINITTNKKKDINEEDNYGDIISTDPTTVEEDINTNRVLFNKLKLKKEFCPKRKRKSSKTISKKKPKKKLIFNQVKKNLQKVDNKLNIINTKLNLNIKTNMNNPEEEEKTSKVKFDEDLITLRHEEEQRKISEFNKINNTNFIQRLKDTQKFLDNDFIITSDKIKKNNSKKKLKLFQLKGDILKK